MRHGLGLHIHRRTALGGVASGIVPNPSDTVAPVVSAVSYSAGNIAATLSEAATVFYLFSASATPIAEAGFATASSGALISGSFTGALGSNSVARSIATLTAGTWYLHAIGQDTAGNRSAVSVVSAAITVAAVDTTAPAITSLAYTGGNATFTLSEAATVYFLFSASATSIAQSAFAAAMGTAPVSDTFTGGASGSNTRAISPTALTAGTWYLHAIAQDTAGNRTATSVVSSGYVVAASDTTPPAITNLTFSGGNATADMSEAGTVYYLFSSSSTPIAQSAFAAAMTSALVKGSFAATAGATAGTIDPAALTAGTWYLHVIGQDAAGNRTANSVVSSAYVVSTAPALVGGTKVAAINAQTQVIAVPAGTANGHLMLLKLGMKAGGAPVTPTGWTLVGSDIASGGNNAGLFVYKRTAASEPANYTIDSGAINSWSIELSVYSGASSVSALNSTRSTSTTSLAGPSLTATANSLIEHIGVFDQDTITKPTGTTLIQQTTSAAGYFGMAVAYEGPVSAGATTARTFTGTTAGSSAVAAALEIKA